MPRLLGAWLVGLAATAIAQAHALYVVPDLADSAKLVVVFSDDLSPDAKIKAETWKKMDGLKLTARSADGTTTDVKWERAEHSLKATVPAGTRVVFGKINYGVSTRGAKPTLVHFYPKAIVGAVPVDGGKIGEAVGLEIVPKVEGGKVRFQVLAAGKPVAGAKVAVMLPEKKDEKGDATTDDQGLTPAFEGTGRYGVTVRHSEEKAGEANGQKYELTNHVATLVMDVK
jgi:uncharacterized GH25 family protein